MATSIITIFTYIQGVSSFPPLQHCVSSFKTQNKDKRQEAAKSQEADETHILASGMCGEPESGSDWCVNIALTSVRFLYFSLIQATGTE